MEVNRIGNIYGENKGTGFAGNVWDKNGLSPTITTMQGGGREPMIIDNVIIGGMQEHQSIKNDGICTCLTSSMGTGGGYTPMIVAMRGRNPDNPSDRTAGIPTEQRLEPNSQGICNTLTSVQKDNLVMEKVVIDDTYANRQPRVYEDYSPALRSEREGLKTIEVKQLGFMDNGTGKHQSNTVYDENSLCPNITTIEGGGTQQIKVMTETYSPYVNQKYEEFFKENGYIPEYFNPYNKTELTDVAPTLTAQGESVTKSSTVLKCDTQYRIRKLTPKECWRLMDFTDEDFNKAAQVNSNTQLYRQAGNSIPKNLLVAIFGQMLPGKENIYKEN